MTYLLAMLFFTADPPVGHDAAFKAARAKYDALIAAAEKSQPMASINKAKAGLADLKRSVINPGVPGMTITTDDMNLRYGPIQFPDARSRQQAIENATETLKKSEADFELRKNGSLPPIKIELPALEFSKLAVGQVGQIGAVETISVLDGTDTLVRMVSIKTGRPEVTPVVVAGRSDRFSGVFWVSGKRTIGKQSLFVIEPLFSD